jgi:transcriptional regulator of heat shock response
MENKRSARFFIETLTGEKLEDIAMVPQEYTYHTKVKKSKKKSTIEDNQDEWEVLSLIRFDFVATIRNDGGECRKVLIEIQKSNKPTNLIRFRTYLGEQYKRMDMVEVSSGKIEKALPIISIYLLGFKLTNIKAAAIKVCRTYIDMIGKTEIKQRNKLIEALTHDGYFVQIPYIKGKPLTSLEKLLSIFEQKYFIDEKNTVKEYDYPIDDDNLKVIVDILKHTASDAKTRREMEEAWWADENEKEYDRLEKELQEKDKSLAEKDKSLAEKDKSLAEKDKSLAEKDREIAELKRLYGVK